MKLERFVIVINFEHDFGVVESEATSIVFPVGVVGAAKIVKGGDGLHQSMDGLGTEAAMPGVMTAPPPRRCFRSSSLSMRMRSASVLDMVVLLLMMF